MSTPSSTKTEIIHAASRMLLSKGLNGFSLQELATALNIKKASLFHHYPSKLALAIELYRFYQDSFLTWVKAHEHLPAEKVIIAYAQELTRWICEKERVCPVGALSLEWHLVEPELQVEIKKLHELQKEWLTKMVKEIQKERKLCMSQAEAVIGIMGLLQGSIQLARLSGDTTIVKSNLKNFLKCMKE